MLNLSGYWTVARRHGLLIAGLFAALLVTGCSGAGMFGSDNSPLPMPPPLEAGDDGVVPDNTGRNETADAAESAKDGEYPELADVPEGAEATKKPENTPDAQAQREQLAGELVADREQAKHTDEELRGGRVPAVAPPRPQAPTPPRPAVPEAAAPAEVVQAPPPPAVPQKPVTQAAPAALPAAGLTPAPAPVRAQAPAPVAAAPARPAPLRPVPAAPARPQAASPQSYSSTAFQPSTAQPLPPDLVASLSPGVAQRYQETLRKPLPGVPAALPVTPALGRGGAAFASIPFASGSAQLSGQDRNIIAQVAQAAMRRGGMIRVVGHASSTTASQSESQRLLANWEVSQARATAVADALVAQGVDAGNLIIEAVGDSQAAYADEASGRRVDLFLE